MQPIDSSHPIHRDQHDVIWVSPWSESTDAEQAAAGRTRVRLLHQMRCQLPLPGSACGSPVLSTRPFEPGLDDAEFLELNQRAFVHHPDQGALDAAGLAQRMAAPWFSPDGFLLHESAGGRIDGFCWTKAHPQRAHDPAMGEIYVIAADPDAQGKGLGRALVCAGLAHLAATGLSVGMLYVESTNQPALSLYESLGFELHHSDAGYATSETSTAP